MLAAVVVVGLSLRLLPLLCHGGFPALFMDPDSWEYHRIAGNLLAGHGYSWDTRPPYSANFYRTPGLPVLLLGLYALAGPSIPAAIALQAVVGTGTILLTYFFASAWTGRRNLALAAAAVQALDPVAVHYSNILLTESFTCPLLLLAGLCVRRYSATARPAWLFAIAGLLGAGILIHPLLLFLPLVLPALPLLARGKRRRQFAAAGLAAVVAWLPAGAWVARNWYLGDLPGISTVAAVNLLKYKAAGVEADLRGTSREVERDRLTAECAAELAPGATPGAECRVWQKRAVGILLAHPLTYAKVHARGMLVELVGPERDHTMRLLYGSATLDGKGEYTDGGIARARARATVRSFEVARHLVLGWQALLGLGLLAGGCRMAVLRPRLLAGLLVVPLYVLALTGGPEGSPRFRVIYLPVFSLLTALGFETILAAGGRVRTAVSRAGAPKSAPATQVPKRTPRVPNPKADALPPGRKVQSPASASLAESLRRRFSYSARALRNAARFRQW
jgi:hypothetical protein